MSGRRRTRAARDAADSSSPVRGGASSDREPPSSPPLSSPVMSSSPARRSRRSPANTSSPAAARDDRPADIDEDEVVDEQDAEIVARGTDGIREDDEEGEDLLDDNYLDDYKEIKELDTYEEEGLDTADHDMMSEEQRRAAERVIREREIKEAKRQGRVPAALRSPVEEEEPPQSKRMRKRMEEAEEEHEDETYVNIEEVKGTLKEWIALTPTRNEIKRRFRQFLTTFVDETKAPVYPNIISRMCSENKTSLPVNYNHLSKGAAILGLWINDVPREMLEILDEEAFHVVQTMFPEYDRVASEIHVRITHLPIMDSLRDLRQSHLNYLVKVSGVVTRRTAVFPQLRKVKFTCLQCGYLSPEYTQTSAKEVDPGKCVECQKNGPFQVNSEETIYRNFQKLTLQESPGTVPAGRVPRQKDVILLHDLIDCARPGEEIEVTGVYTNSFDASLNTRQGFPVFRTVIEANFVSKRNDEPDLLLTDEDVKQILALSKKPNVAQILFNSCAPSIWGHENIKIGVTLAMFGGEPKKSEKSKHQLRGDINVLVLGDPGTAKSQFLKYVEKTAPRAVYTTGKGASAVGLTASVRTDPLTREWTLEGGALVLADKGVCLIDEFDKMNDQDRTSIHEAMEQQTISISKAGIVCTLQARCSVIAAANPVSGRYDSSVPFHQNVELTDAILSRFDILCVVRDTVDPVADEKLANFVISSHARSHPEKGKDAPAEPAPTVVKETVSQDLLRKYVMYARQNCHPKLANIDDDKIVQLYSELRRESTISGGIPIAVRHIESMIRIAEAHAKLHLRDHVRDDDVDMAIRVMLESFISTQKFAVIRSLQRQFAKYLTFQRDSHELLLYSLQAMVKTELADRLALQGPSEPGVPIDLKLEDFEAKAKELNVHDLSGFFTSDLFAQNNFELDRKAKVIRFHNSV